MDGFALEAGAAAAFRLVDAANEYIAETEPWALARDERHADRLSQVLFDVAEAVRVAAILLLPICRRRRRRSCAASGRRRPHSTRCGWTTRRGGTKESASFEKGDALWPRVDAPSAGRTAPRHPAGRSLRLRGKLRRPGRQETRRSDQEQNVADQPNATSAVPTTAAATAPQVPAVTPASGDNRITIDDFMKVDLARREGARRREGAELAQADEAADRRRHRAAHAGGRHRRGV